MPRQTRWAVKQKLDGVEGNLKTAQDKLSALGSMYHEQHPTHYEILCAMVSSLEQIREVIVKFREGV